MRKLTGLIVVIITLAACGPVNQSSSAPQAWIDSPLDGSVLPLAETDVMSHAADPGGLTQFELSVDGTVISSDPAPGSDALVYIHQAWNPTAPGIYTLEVHAMNTTGEWSEMAQVTVTIQGEQPTEQAVPSPVQIPGTVKTNAICRVGPSLDYEILEYLNEGTPVIIIGQNQTGTWYQINLPGGNGNCWMSAKVLNPGGETGGVPVVTVAPPNVFPTDQPAQGGCYVFNQQTQQNVCVVPCPANAQPGGACNP